MLVDVASFHYITSIEPVRYSLTVKLDEIVFLASISNHNASHFDSINVTSLGRPHE